MADINECSICLELLDNTYQLYVLECGHKYHTTCLTDWYKNPIAKYKCPLCNEKSDIINVTNSLKTISSINPMKGRNSVQSNSIDSYETVFSRGLPHNTNKTLNNHKKNNCIIL